MRMPRTRKLDLPRGDVVRGRQKRVVSVTFMNVPTNRRWGGGSGRHTGREDAIEVLRAFVSRRRGYRSRYSAPSRSRNVGPCGFVLAWSISPARGALGREARIYRRRGVARIRRDVRSEINRQTTSLDHALGRKQGHDNADQHFDACAVANHEKGNIANGLRKRATR